MQRGGRFQGWCRALCTAPSVPPTLSVALPLAIFALTCLFLASNFLQLAETYVSLKAGGSETGWGPSSLSDSLVQVYQVMVYSLFYSIKQLRQEKLNALANLLMAFSGVLPYLKLLLMFVAWVAPVRLLSYRWRGRILLAMDQFGKYSLVDVFVIQFISGALCSTIDLEVLLASGSAAPADLGPTPAVLLRTSQSKGFAAFVLATVGSLIVGHICLYCHQRDPAVKAAEALEAAAAAARGRGRAGRRPTGPPGERRWPRYVGCLLALAVALVVCGCAMTAFTVQLVTPFGKLSEASHTLFGFAWALPRLAEEPDSFPTRFGQVTYILFAVANIHLHLLLLYCAWLGRLPAAWLPRMATLARTLFAWSALDVAVLSMVITLLEMSTSNFVPLTSDMRHFLGKVLGRPIPQPGLEVKVWLGPGSFLLMAGALVHYFASKEVMHAMDQTVFEQEQAALCLREALSLGSLPSVPEGSPSPSARCFRGVVQAEAEASMEEGHSSELVQAARKTVDVAMNI